MAERFSLSYHQVSAIVSIIQTRVFQVRVRGGAVYPYAHDLRRIYEKVAILYADSPLSVSAESRETASFVMEEVEFHLVDSGLFTMVDRQALDSIRSEQYFQMSGEVNDASAVSVGNMLGANMVITGSISRIGGVQRIIIKVLDVKTGHIVTMAREHY